jgi:hypothetical protein
MDKAVGEDTEQPEGRDMDQELGEDMEQQKVGVRTVWIRQ